jgi:hypothetical protein
MKLSKKLFAAAATLGLAVAATVGSTYAWFSMNTTVTATGMQVKATTASSLVIEDDQADVGTSKETTVTFTAYANALTPTTHDWTTGATNGLKYVTNLNDVDVASGFGHGGAELTYGDAVNTESAFYFKDYVVYIASTGTGLTDQDLTVKLNPDDADVFTNKEMLKAVSVDFYVGDVSSASYKGTINFRDNQTVTLVANGAIPLQTAGSIMITMRVYVDGALETADTTGIALVTNQKITTDGLGFSAEFQTANHVDVES